MASATVSLILEKIASKDKDYRYMATSDLLNELSKAEFKADADTEQKICQVVLQQLEDASGDIAGLAVKCLAPLVKKVNEARVVNIVETLCQKLLRGKEQQRDIASIGLKTVVSEAPFGAIATATVKVLTPRLLDGISSPDVSPEVRSECLDILQEELQRFGPLLIPEHERLRDALLPQLDSTRAGIRKRTIQCVGVLVASMTDSVLLTVSMAVIQKLQQEDMKPDLIRTYIQTVGALSRSVGYRFGRHLKDVVPILLSYCRNASENDDELRENSLQALESFIQRCPREVTDSCPLILDVCLEYIKYDPNFTDDMEEDGNASGEDEADEDEESGEEYSDDEDISWKVRRAAAKCLGSVITSRPELLPTVYAKACPELLTRFREREENVKLDVFAAFSDLLRQTGSVMRVYTSPEGPEPASSPANLLRAAVPDIVKAINRQLKEKSLKTKVGAFSLLKELVQVLPNSLDENVPTLVPGVERALTDKQSNSNVKIEALLFLRLLMASHAPEVFQPYVQTLSGPVLACVNERYYKVTAEALRVCSELVKVIRPRVDGSSTFDFQPYVKPLYTCILQRLTAQDQDQEVKECAIGGMGLVLALLGDKLGDQLSLCLPLLLDRLRNEITRLATVKAFQLIAESTLHIDLSSVLDPTITELTSFLRKANRALRQASLSTLDALVTGYADIIPSATYDTIITEASALINDSDLQLAALALQLFCTMLARTPSTAESLRDKVLPQALALVKSALLQGQALQSLQAFFASLVYTNTPSATYEDLLNALLAAGTVAAGPVGAAASAASSPTNRQAFHSVAQCVAVLCLAAGDSKCVSTADMLVGNLQNASTEDSKRLLSLLCLGEIGHRQDLSAHANALVEMLVSALQAQSEEVKIAASYALGNIASGNLPKYLPFILNKIEAEPKLQYLLLHSLKEVISRQASHTAASQLSSQEVQQILGLLFKHCESEEEGIRNVVAECLGKLAVIAPETVLPALKQGTSSTSAFTRAAVVTALKYTIVDKPQLDRMVQPMLQGSLCLMKDDDRHVRKAAVQTLSSAAHSKAGLVVDLLPELLPLLYEQTAIRKDLIRVVDLGPFKHTVDDGLELRKAAFECMDTLLDACPDRIDTSEFISHLLSGLSDHYDVKMPCHLVLSKLAVIAGPAVLAVLDDIVEPLDKTLNTKTKADAVKQEVDRNEDMLRSALRAVDALCQIRGVENCVRFKNFVATLKKGPLAAKFSAIRAENNSMATSLDA
eukprot:jgi/Chlat1/2550/Chrsp175S02405